MAVTEYKMHTVGFRGERQQPMWVRESGHWFNPDDHTFIGWVVDNTDYYIPDTLNLLTREQFVARQLAIHANHPFRKYTGSLEQQSEQSGDTDNWSDKTDAEVQLEMEEWYDLYVLSCADISK
jgi:hypothetical protein